MARLTRFQWARITAGFEIVPPTLMVAMGDPWLGAATLGAVLAASVLQSWMFVRSVRERQRALLSYAQNTITMGGDPTSVIAALRGSVANTEDDDMSPDLPPRGYDQREHGGHPDPGGTWQRRSPPG